MARRPRRFSGARESWFAGQRGAVVPSSDPVTRDGCEGTRGPLTNQGPVQREGTVGLLEVCVSVRERAEQGTALQVTVQPQRPSRCLEAGHRSAHLQTCKQLWHWLARFVRPPLFLELFIIIVYAYSTWSS